MTIPFEARHRIVKGIKRARNFADRRCHMKYVNGNYKSVILKR